tara:strand:+ start:760 stop:897 length:138 start_codon:yes stop_codon:yes gene_type:complete
MIEEEGKEIDTSKMEEKLSELGQILKQIQAEVVEIASVLNRTLDG